MPPVTSAGFLRYRRCLRLQEHSRPANLANRQANHATPAATPPAAALVLRVGRESLWILASARRHPRPGDAAVQFLLPRHCDAPATFRFLPGIFYAGLPGSQTVEYQR